MLTPVIYPDKALSTPAQIVTTFDDNLHNFATALGQMMHDMHLVGVAANMVGNLQQIIVLNGKFLNLEQETVYMVNPVVTVIGTNKHRAIEASPSLPFIETPIERPAHIFMKYQTLTGESQEGEYLDDVAHVIQHEMDYVAGQTFLDRIPKAKARLLKEKMFKLIRTGGPKIKPHVHGAHCNH